MAAGYPISGTDSTAEAGWGKLHAMRVKSRSLRTTITSGAGTVHSFTVIRQHGVPPFPECVPFVVALVELAEPGARVLAAMPTVAPDAVAIGMPVRATFRAAHDPQLGFVDFESVG